MTKGHQLTKEWSRIGRYWVQILSSQILRTVRGPTEGFNSWPALYKVLHLMSWTCAWWAWELGFSWQLEESLWFLQACPSPPPHHHWSTPAWFPWYFARCFSGSWVPLCLLPFTFQKVPAAPLITFRNVPYTHCKSLCVSLICLSIWHPGRNVSYYSISTLIIGCLMPQWLHQPDGWS